MNKFEAFDPLQVKQSATSDVAARSLKREIRNILSSYVGWYDPFAELIQNSLDSLDERALQENVDYIPRIWITVNINDNYLIVTDNGVGLNEQKFKSFLAPDFSFKSGKTRGHKGVGATYLAYGFNFIQVSTKAEDFTAIGKMVDARKWLSDENPSGNPQVKYDETGALDPIFNDIDKGVSIYLKFDQHTHPKDLSWVKADTADAWLKILSVKTGLGAFFPNNNIKVELTVIKKNGLKDFVKQDGIEYLWPEKIVRKAASYKQLDQKRKELFEKGKDIHKLPSPLKDLDVFYGKWSEEELVSLLKIVDKDELEICTRYTPTVYFGYAYSLKVWDTFNKALNIRSNSKILFGGIQIAANNMPQGDMIQIPLLRNIGRQNQVHMVFHFDNCSADLGRKGFQSEIVEFTKEISKRLIDGPLQKLKYCLKTNTGAPPDLFREKEVEDWKEEMANYEKEHPLQLISNHFFLPLRKISITSTPSREQDVIALFNQMIAGGVIRGIRIMSTNERFTYDGLFKIIVEEPIENHVYNEVTNPLGVLTENVESIKNFPFISKPRILEYKFSLDGLIENMHDGSKNSNDIGLAVVWETGESYLGSYKITSLLDENNLSLRQYHGLTHIMTNITSGQREMDLIVLSELIEYLNDPKVTQQKQIEKYED
ncbi:ATP-binding protein [Paenibacillus rhizophilus]|uniref:ATP-binding protein n=1 Tax=Paenibacillus rhizophilus TaxID=1850366 RepID=A0A3N9NY56_9BACL|nr:ATP-binding protein [Paenibacillus rhizophilus]RQW08831.1 ATP-binding protein [Paenibacillus rhizophilus]